MKLVIRENRESRFAEGDTYYLGCTMLKMKSVHMFIGKNKWESIDIELSDSIPQGALRFFPKVCSNIIVQPVDNVTEIRLRQLTELFPDKGGKLRRAYFAGGNVMEVLH